MWMQPMWRSVPGGMLVGILAVAVWASCTTDVAVAPTNGTGPIAEYFQGDQDLYAGACPGAPTPFDVGGSVSARLYRGPGVANVDLVKTTSRIDGFFRRYGITFSTMSPPSEIWHRTIIGGSVSEMLFAQGLCLPSGSALEASERERLSALFRTTPEWARRT